jgi:cardiolipin synthase
VVCIQILLTTSNSSKALAYIMFSIFIPVVGMGFYLIFGEDYWNKKRYRSKLKQNQEILEQLNADMLHFNEPNRILESQSLS